MMLLIIYESHQKFSRESGNGSTYQRLPKHVGYSESKDRLVKHTVRHFQSCLHNSSVKSVSVLPTQQPIHLSPWRNKDASCTTPSPQPVR